MANDPLVVRGGSSKIPYILLNEFDLIDTAGDEAAYEYSVGVTAPAIPRNDLANAWQRSDVGNRVAGPVTVNSFSQTLPLNGEIGDHVDISIPDAALGTSAIGGRVWVTYGPGTGYQIKAAVNDYLRADYTGVPDGPLGYGYQLTTGQQTETGATTGATELTLAAVGATEKVIANAHVTAFTGTDATLKVQRDDVWAMTTPEDIITFSQFTGVGSDHQETAVGANTETKSRFDLSTSGGITSITVVVTIAIVPSA